MTRLRTLAVCLAAGWIATTLAATASLTVNGTTTKRIVWITVAVSVSVVAGYTIGRLTRQRQDLEEPA